MVGLIHWLQPAAILSGRIEARHNEKTMAKIEVARKATSGSEVLTYLADVTNASI